MLEIAYHSKGNKYCHKARRLYNSRKLGTEAVNEGHIKHGKRGYDMLQPILIISVIAGTCGRNYRRSKKGEQSQSEAHIKANGIYEFALFKHHKRGKDASPSAYLQGEFVKHIMLRKVTRSYVYKTPIIGHLGADQQKGQHHTGALQQIFQKVLIHGNLL